ncbi:MAG: hypothetical protein AAGI53_01565 [Planctomycetota bacterium]
MLSESVEAMTTLLSGVTVTSLPTFELGYGDLSELESAVDDAPGAALIEVGRRESDAVVRLDAWPVIEGAGAVGGSGALWSVRPVSGGAVAIEPLASFTFAATVGAELDLPPGLAESLKLTAARYASTINLTDHGVVAVRTNVGIGTVPGDPTIRLPASLTLFDRGPATRLIFAVARDAAASVGLVRSGWR